MGTESTVTAPSDTNTGIPNNESNSIVSNNSEENAPENNKETPIADPTVNNNNTVTIETPPVSNSNVPGSSPQVAGWTWPATLSNTGPASGTVFTTMAPREFTTADNGKTFENIQINVGDGQEFYITGSNITFKNCKIIYTGSTHSPNGFLFIGKSWISSIRPKNIVFDHCIIDSGNRHEYGLTANHGQFTIQYSQIRGASHNIESTGDLDPGTTTTIYRNYIYDYSNNPFSTSYDVNNSATWGHPNGIYFTGNNGTVIIEENTIIANRWQQCTSGWSNGPGAGCFEIGGTGAVTVYADENPNPDRIYIVKHNQISGAGYFPIRFYSGGTTIDSVSIINNVLTAQAGWNKSSIEGSLYVFSGSIGSITKSGNSWGSDTVCFVNPSSCKDSPN